MKPEEIHDMMQKGWAAQVAHRQQIEDRRTQGYDRLSAEEQYRVDPVFRQFVDMVEALIGNGDLTPSEIRKGAILAATHYEMKRSPTIRCSTDYGIKE